jgi:deoxyribonuclease V
VYVSVGHRISIETACHWVLRLAPAYRIPEPLRAANRLSKAALTHGAESQEWRR